MGPRFKPVLWPHLPAGRPALFQTDFETLFFPREKCLNMQPGENKIWSGKCPCRTVRLGALQGLEEQRPLPAGRSTQVAGGAPTRVPSPCVSVWARRVRPGTGLTPGCVSKAVWRVCRWNLSSVTCSFRTCSLWSLGLPCFLGAEIELANEEPRHSGGCGRHGKAPL